MGQNGRCITQDTLQISLRDCETILLFPNIITPNGDGLNDEFGPIEFKGVYEPFILIFNRSGKEVYRSNDLETTWSPPSSFKGTYYFLVSYQDYLENQNKVKGFFTIFR